MLSRVLIHNHDYDDDDVGVLFDDHLHFWCVQRGHTPPAKHDHAADSLDVGVHHVHSRGQGPPPQLNGEAQRHRGLYRVE